MESFELPQQPRGTEIVSSYLRISSLRESKNQKTQSAEQASAQITEQPAAALRASGPDPVSAS